MASQKFRIFSNLNIFKKSQKSNENFITFESFKRFCDFLKSFSNFIDVSRRFMENFRKFWKYGFVGGSGAEPPEARENI